MTILVANPKPKTRGPRELTISESNLIEARLWRLTSTWPVRWLLSWKECALESSILYYFGFGIESIRWWSIYLVKIPGERSWPRNHYRNPGNGNTILFLGSMNLLCHWIWPKLILYFNTILLLSLHIPWCFLHVSAFSFWKKTNYHMHNAGKNSVLQPILAG